MLQMTFRLPNIASFLCGSSSSSCDFFNTMYGFSINFLFCFMLVLPFAFPLVSWNKMKTEKKIAITFYFLSFFSQLSFFCYASDCFFTSFAANNVEQCKGEHLKSQQTSFSFRQNEPFDSYTHKSGLDLEQKHFKSMPEMFYECYKKNKHFTRDRNLHIISNVYTYELSAAFSFRCWKLKHHITFAFLHSHYIQLHSKRFPSLGFRLPQFHLRFFFMR